MPLTLNTLNRALLKKFAGDEYDIFLTNKPFWLRYENKTVEETRAERSPNSARHVVVPVLFLFFTLSSYWPAIFISFYIKERTCKAKLLQIICGVNEIIYWITSFLFDFTIFFIIICLILGKVAIYQSPQFDTFENLSRYLIIFAFYGFGMLPFLYLFSYLFSKHSTGESLVPLFCIVCELNFKIKSFNNLKL